MAAMKRSAGMVLVVWAAAAAGAPPGDGGIVRVPVAAPHIVIVGEPEWREPPVPPANEILLRGFPAAPPADVQEAVEALRAALPPDWLSELMRSFGYVPNRAGRHGRTRRSDLRRLDLARFLFERWVAGDPETVLAREFSCISTGEFDISVFLTLLTEAERGVPEDEEAWRPGPDRGRNRLANVAQNDARAAWSRCKQLVARGWTVAR